MGLEREAALTLSCIALMIYLGFCILAGVLVDRFGRRKLNIAGTIGFILLLFPAFLMLDTGSFPLIILGLVMIGACQSLVSVSTVVLMVELFPASSRASGSATGFNFSTVLIAGPGPFIAAWLAASTGSAVAPAAYLIVVSLLALPALFRWLPETKGRDLHSSELIGHKVGQKENS